MRIPKYIDEALRKRANAAFRFLQYDDVVSEFIRKHNIDVNFEDYGGGVESISNPYGSERQCDCENGREKEK